MDKSALKTFAIEARRELLDKVLLKAQYYNLTKNSIKDPNEINRKIIGNIPLKIEEINARNKIINKMRLEGYDNVIEEIAYIWFNRFIAIKFMESNNYFPDFLPSGMKIISVDESDEIQVLKNPFEIIDFIDFDRNIVKELYKTQNNNDLFKKIIIKLNNKLHKYMPFMFEEINDYTELLFPDNLFMKDSFIVKMTKDIPEEDWNNVEIIGWLYQFYISEKKDETMSKKKAYEKSEIPFVTQLFTPEWIVRYMTENSLGKLWVEVKPDTILKEKWEYFLEDPNQEDEVKEKLEKIRYKNIKPEDIKVIDPCCGSGHILVYAFDVLYDIYKETGELETEIPKLILKNNLFGLDIDKRAAQLAYFSLLMKARGKNRRFFRNAFDINVYEVIETNELDEESVDLLTKDMNEEEKRITEDLLNKFKNAKLYGSLIEVENIDFSFILKHLEKLDQDNLLYFEKISKLKEIIPNIIKIAKVLKEKYDVVITNPPYMGNKYIPTELRNYLEKHYPDSKSDLFAVFIERNFKFLKENGFNSMITMQSWMFLSSFENLRKKIIENKTILSLIHLGVKAFEEIDGEVVQTQTFIIRNIYIPNFYSKYIRLVEFKYSLLKEKEFFNFKNLFTINSEKFKKIPGYPIAYWVSDKIIKIFEKSIPLGKIAEPKIGLSTGENKKFLRFWFEVYFNNIGFGFASREEAKNSGLKWFPHNKGGEFRKWYGNQEYVINWKNDGEEIRNFKDEYGKLKSRPQNTQFYFKEGLTWSKVSSSKFSAYFHPKGMIFDSAVYYILKDSNSYYLLAFLLSKLNTILLKEFSQTLNYTKNDIIKLPLIFPENNNFKEKIDSLIQENIEISKEDWNDFETSWEFKKHPLLKFKDNFGKIENAFENWEKYAEERFNKLKKNEEELNKMFLEIYDLSDEITPEVDEKEITINKADRIRDIKSFISYGIGCILGRYSPDKEDLVFAGGKFDLNNYPNYKPDEDGILPILDDDYNFEDDIVSKFVSFVEYTFGKENLEENLEYIAKTLNENSTDSRETLRKYFIKDFYKDHTRMYKKRPIYWMFSSGKNGAFKALIYMHRYDEDMISRLRTEYLFRVQRIYEERLKTLSIYLENPENLTKSDKKKYEKEYKKLRNYIEEIRDYDEKVQHYADQRIKIDLDDGVEENYKIFADILEKI